jgi:hypothetical protein
VVLQGVAAAVDSRSNTVHVVLHHCNIEVVRGYYYHQMDALPLFNLIMMIKTRTF